MKSRTSFFNTTVFKKDILRFAPIWAVYTVIILFYSIMNSDRSSPSVVAHSLSTFGTAPVLYAFICATFLFGDLFNTRMCNALHAMPLRRETFFFTHFAAGMLYALIPNLLCSICMVFMMKDYPALPWLWLAVNTGLFFFYFSLAVFCIMCAGNRLGHVAVYCFILFFFPLIGVIYTTIYEPLLYGIHLDDTVFSFLSPPTNVFGQSYFDWRMDSGYYASSYTYNGIITEDWLYLGACDLAGAGFLFGALSLYRRRNLENAGNFITSKVLAYALLLLGSLISAILIPVVGFIIAFIGICMLIERSLKVFHKKNIIIFAAFAGSVLLTIGLTVLDPLDITNVIPKIEDVESVTVQPNYSNLVTFTDGDDIQTILDLHAQALEEKDSQSKATYNIGITYTLKNGKTLHRQYDPNLYSSETKALKRSLSSMEVILGTDDLTALKKDIRYISGNTPSSNGIDYVLYDFEGLLNALALDAQEGTLAQDSEFHTQGIAQILTITFADNEKITVYLYRECTHTLEFLKDYT